LLINQLKQEIVGVKVKLFADDVKVYVQILSSRNADKLQCALDFHLGTVYSWLAAADSIN